MAQACARVFTSFPLFFFFDCNILCLSPSMGMKSASERKIHLTNENLLQGNVRCRRTSRKRNANYTTYRWYTLVLKYVLHGSPMRQLQRTSVETASRETWEHSFQFVFDSCFLIVPINIYPIKFVFGFAPIGEHKCLARMICVWHSNQIDLPIWFAACPGLSIDMRPMLNPAWKFVIFEWLASFPWHCKTCQLTSMGTRPMHTI